MQIMIKKTSRLQVGSVFFNVIN